MRSLKYLSFSILFCLGFMFPVHGQEYPVQVQILVQPPYSPYFQDYILYENRATFILTGQPNVDGAPYEVYFRGFIEGDNDVSIETDDNYRPSSPISVPAGGQVILMGSDLEEYFSYDNLTFSGIDEADVLLGDGLPEGNYTICLTAFDWNTEEQLSPDVPSGCSAPVPVVHIDPPQIMTPACGFEVPAQDPQQLIISWTLPATGIPMQVEYNLQITELYEGQDPNEAFDVLLTPVFFEVTTTANTYIFGLADPELEVGRSYAMRVQATDPNEQILFRNDGYSEVCQFDYEHFGMFDFPTELERGVFSSIDANPFPGFLFPVSTVSGKLHYKFKGYGAELTIDQGAALFDANALFPDGQETGDAELEDIPLTLQAGQVNVSEFTQKFQLLTPSFNTSNISAAGSHPLANMNIKLVQIPLFFESIYTSEDQGQLIYSQMKTIASTKTDGDGNFTMTFMNPGDLGVGHDFLWITNPGEIIQGAGFQGQESTEGIVYKVLRLIVESPYYCSPETNIVLDNWESLDLGVQVSYVNSYTLKVQAKKIQDERYMQFESNIDYLPNIDATLKRYDFITGLPVDEGEKSYPEPGEMVLYNNIVAQGKTDSYGFFEIRRLVRHDEDNPLDHYKIIFETSEYSGEYNYQTKGKNIPPCTGMSEQPYTNDGTAAQIYLGFLWNSDHVETIFTDYVVLRPKLPRIYGQVRAKQMPVDMNEAMDNFLDQLTQEMTVQNAVNSFQGVQSQQPQTLSASSVGLFSTPSGSSGFNFGGYVSMAQQLQNWGQSANLIPVPNAGMVLFSYCPPGISPDYECYVYPAYMFESTYTDDDGRYEFNNLWMLEDLNTGNEITGDVFGPARKVLTKPTGFKYQELPTDAQGHKVLVWGEQLQLNFNLEPDGFVFGWVEDDKGNPAKATVFIDSLTTVETVFDPPWKVLLDVGSEPREIFVLRAPSGVRTLTIVPDDPGLGVAEYEVNIDENESEFAPQNLGGFVVNTYKHRIKFTVMQAGIPFYDINAGKTYQVQEPVKNVLVKVNNIQSNAPEQNTRYANPPSEGLQPAQQLHVYMLTEATWGYTNSDGEIVLNFQNNANQFEIEFLPPLDRQLVKKTLNINSEPTLTTVDHGTVLLEPALSLVGVVTYGQDSLPLPGARVFIDLAGEFYSTRSDQDGKYKLLGMPKDADSYEVIAENLEVPGTLIADSKTISSPFPSVLNFHLQQFTDFAIETLYDIPVSIQSVNPQGDNYVVSGAFVNLPANENFRARDADTRLKFSNVEVAVVQENNQPVAEPVSDEINLLETNLELWSYTELIATQLPPENSSKLKVEADTEGRGAVKGRIRLESSSFQFDENYMNLNGEQQSSQSSTWEGPVNQLQVMQASNMLQITPALTQQMVFISLFVNSTSELHYFDAGANQYELATINAAPYPERPFNLHNGQGQNFEFKIQDFHAEARKAESYVYRDTVHLATSIFAEQIPLMVPAVLEVDLGMVNINKTGFEEITGDSPLQFNLEEWQVTCDNWTLNQYSLGIQADEGELVTSLFTTDLRNIRITNTYFAQPQIDMNQLALGGVIDVNVLSGTTFFGINPSCTDDGQEHWELSVLSDAGGPAVSINALPGMAPGDQIFFDQAGVWSNGYQRLDMGAVAQELRFYNVVNVTPTNLEFLPDGVKLTGMFDLEVPRMSKGTGGFIYHKTPSGLEAEFTGMMVSFIAKGKVHFAGSNLAGAQVIQDKLFEARGYVEDEQNPGFQLEALFRKDVINDSILVFVDPLHQVLPVADDGSNYMAEVTGRMYVDKNLDDWGGLGMGDWDYFRFSCDMEGFLGVEASQKRKSFTVYGAIQAEGEGMDIQNISADFGGLSITYDFPNARLTGQLQFNESFATVHIGGAANFLADRDGWYFVADGNLDIPGFGSLAAGLGIGDYVIVNKADQKNQFLLTKLSKNAYKNQLPNSFMDGFSGFFFTARKSIPQFDIPDVSFDFGIVSAYMGGEAGLNALLWMEFAGPGTEFGVGVMAYVDAYLGMSSITCTTIEGSVSAVLGILGVFNTGTGAYSITGCGGITIEGTVIQGYPDPTTLECADAIEVSDSVSFKAEIEVSNSGFDATLGMGECFDDNMTNEF